MYVIKADVAAGAALASQFGAANDSTALTDIIIPAEQCSWQQREVDKGYELYNAQYHPNNGATDVVPVTNAVLGYIGKTGRFTAITN